MRTDGDCFVAAFNQLVCFGENMPVDVLLVHGLVVHPRYELRHVHAWLEVGAAVVDFSNGHRALMSRPHYYAAGGVQEGLLVRYSYEDAIRLALEFATYGPWDEDLLAGDQSDGIIDKASGDMV